MTSNHTDALIIFAKWPEPGKVKTRLTPPFSLEEAAELYRCMLIDTLNATSGFTGINRLIFFDGPAERAADFSIMAPDAQIFRQNGNDLGERLTDAFETAFIHGFRNVAVIGSDSPHMPVERITEAFSCLNGGDTDAIFGPTEDGGYYLVGMNRTHPELFRDIPWSSSHVLNESVSRLKDAGITAVLIEKCYDLDTAEDLRRLLKDSHLPYAAHTIAMLDQIQQW